MSPPSKRAGNGLHAFSLAEVLMALLIGSTALLLLTQLAFRSHRENKKFRESAEPERRAFSVLSELRRHTEAKVPGEYLETPVENGKLVFYSYTIGTNIPGKAKLIPRHIQAANEGDTFLITEKHLNGETRSKDFKKINVQFALTPHTFSNQYLDAEPRLFADIFVSGKLVLKHMSLTR
ncbi:MAG: hypothetical protein JNM63_05565 [Spirochaetia bacterium]|nr:hypothetical protein [Spirochaetia bacterium]